LALAEITSVIPAIFFPECAALNVIKFDTEGVEVDALL